MRRVCLGGTFEVLHRGHEALLGRAFEVGDHVFIGITDGALARRGRKRVSAFASRKRRLQAFLKKQGWTSHTLGRLTDEAGPAARTEAVVLDDGVGDQSFGGGFARPHRRHRDAISE